MTCSHCNTWNDEYEHRCVRCARRLSDDEPVRQMVPAAPRHHYRRAGTAFADDDFYSGSSYQQERLPRHISAESFQYAQYAPEPAPRLALPAYTTEPNGLQLAQPHFDWNLHAPGAEAFYSPSRPVRPALRTSIEAVIYCDAPIATPFHRLLASALDTSLIAIAIGIFVGVLCKMSFPFPADRVSLLAYAASAGLIAIGYHVLWALAGTETPGMAATNLEVLTFDGERLTRNQRLRRLVVYSLCLAAAGLGVVWAVVDEQMLTWHDHASRTFPTPVGARRRSL